MISTNIICYDIHPARNPRFGSFRTQPLEIISADSVSISLKPNPTLGTNVLWCGCGLCVCMRVNTVYT